MSSRFNKTGAAMDSLYNCISKVSPVPARPKLKNMRLVLNLLVVVLALGSMQSCVSKKKFDELLASKEAADKALAETQTKVANLEKENGLHKSFSHLQQLPQYYFQQIQVQKYDWQF